MIKDWEKSVNELVKASEQAKHYPDKFVNSIEYFHSVFAYILSLIEVKKQNKN